MFYVNFKWNLTLFSDKWHWFWNYGKVNLDLKVSQIQNYVSTSRICIYIWSLGVRALLDWNSNVNKNVGQEIGQVMWKFTDKYTILIGGCWLRTL